MEHDNTAPNFALLPLGTSKYLPYCHTIVLGTSKYERVKGTPTPQEFKIRRCFWNFGWSAVPFYYSSKHLSSTTCPRNGIRGTSARKDELQGRARKSECPKRSVATQVFRISASAARLSAWVTVALTFFCLLFLCQDKKRRWGPVGASPHPVADGGSGPYRSRSWGVCNTPLP